MATLGMVGSLLLAAPLSAAVALDGWSAASVSTFAGSGQSGQLDGTGTAATFVGPRGVAIGGGFAYVSDVSKIRRVSLATADVTTVATDNGTGCVVTATTAIAVDSDYLYFVSSCAGNTWLRRMALSTGVISVIRTSFNPPQLAMSPTGVLYAVLGAQVLSVDKVTGATTVVATVPPAPSGPSVSLSAIALDGSSIWVVDSTLHRLVKVDPGSGTSSELSRLDVEGPLAVRDGFVYAGVFGKKAVRQFSGSDGSSVTVAGNKNTGFMDGTGGQAWFAGIDGMASDGTVVLVPDSPNRRLRLLASAAALPAVQPDRWSTTVSMTGGKLVRVAGGATGVVDGRGANAGFGNPAGMHVVGDEGYVFDSSKLRKVNLITGVVSTIAGLASSSCPTDSTSPMSANLNSNGDMAADSTFLYFTDSCSNGDRYLRRMSLATGAVSTLFIRSSGVVAGYSGLTIGPDGRLYGAHALGGQIDRIDTVNASWSQLLQPQSPSGAAATAVELAGDSEYLWSSVSYSCPGGTCVGIVRVDPSTATQTFIVAPSSNASVLPNGQLVSAGDYLYGPFRDNTQSGNIRVGLGRWSKADGAFLELTNGPLTGGPQFTGIDVHAQGLVVADATSKRVYRVLNVPTPLEPCGQCLEWESVGGGSLSQVAGTQNCHCDPINTATGALFESVTDLAIPGRGLAAAFSRGYDTQRAGLAGRLGYGWRDSYGMSLAVDATSSGPLATAGLLALTEENGAVIRFVRNSDGSYSAASRVLAGLERHADGTFTFTRRAQATFTFDATGRLATLRDMNGYVTTLGYDGSGRLATVTEPAGRALTLGYDASSRVVSVTDTSGRAVGYGYDGAGNLATVTDVRGKTWTYGYDAQHRLTTMTDARNYTTTTVYDADGRAISQTDRADETTTFDYTIPTDTGSWVVTITDPRGAVTKEVYERALLVGETKAVGTSLEATWTHEHDAVTNARTSTVDPLEHVWSSTYDSRGNLLSSADPLGHGGAATYNALNQPLTVTDALGVTTTNTYDAAGNLLTTSTPLLGSSPPVSATKTYTYGDPLHPGDVTAVTDARGKVWRSEYDSYGQVVSSTDPLGNETTFDHTCSPAGTGCRSNVGWIYKTVSPRGNASGGTPAQHTTSVTRDDAGLLLTSTDQRGKVTTFEYDANGNRIKVTDAKGQLTESTFDELDRVIELTRPDNTTLLTSYDAHGNVVTQTNGLGKITTYTYDLLNRVRTSKDPLNRTTSYGYDAAGRLTTTTDALNRVTTFGYDVANRRTSVDYEPGTPDVTFGYDDAGRRTSMIDGTGTSTVTYDSLGRVTATTNGAGKTVGYGYDLAGNRTSITYPNGKSVTRAVDDAGQLSSITDWLSQTSTFTPDPDGNLVSTALGNGVVTTRTVDDANRLMKITHKLGATTLASFDYTRDDLGLLTSETPAAGPSETYGYDNRSRLTELNSTSFGYDAADDLVGLPDGTRQDFDDANQLTAAQPPITLIGTGSAQDSGTGSSLSVALPARRAGDVVLLSVVTATGQTVSTPAGFSPRGAYAPAGNQTKISTFTRAVPSGETGAVAVAFGTGLTAKAVLAAVYRGVTAATPIEASSTDSSTTTGSLTLPSVTSLTDGAKLVLFAGETANATAQTFSTPAGMAAQVQASSQPLVSAALFDEQLGTAGATGTRATSVALPGHVVGVLWALKPIAPTTFSYNNVGDRTGRVDPLAGATSYGFDHASRLTSVTGGISYAYDGTGLRASKTVGGVTTSFTWDVAGGLPLLLDDGTYSYVYDGQGRVLEQIQNTPSITLVGTGANQNSGSGATLAVALPSGIRPKDQILLSVTASATQTVNTPVGYTLVQAATATGNTSQTVVFRRTAAGAETSATVSFGTGLTPKSVLAAVYRGVDSTTPVDVKNTGVASVSSSLTVGSVTTSSAGARLVLLAGATGNASAATWSAPPGMSRQVHLGSQPLVSSMIADQALGAAGATGSRTAGLSASGDLSGVLLALKVGPAPTFYHQHDQLGSTRLVTTQHGDVAATFTYSPYGVTTGQTGWHETPFQYAGEYRDGETDLIYLRARYYDPATAQFLSRDPIEAVTRSPYVYVAGSPLNATDPSGLFCVAGHNDDGTCRGSGAVRRTLESFSTIGSRASVLGGTLTVGSFGLLAPIGVPVAVVGTTVGFVGNAGSTAWSCGAFGSQPDLNDDFVDCGDAATYTAFDLVSMGFGRVVVRRCGEGLRSRTADWFTAWLGDGADEDPYLNVPPPR